MMFGARRHMLGVQEVEFERKPGCKIRFPGLSVRHPYPADWQEGDRKHFLDAALFQKLYLTMGLPGSDPLDPQTKQKSSLDCNLKTSN